MKDILLALAEEVLSRGLSFLVTIDKLKLIKGNKTSTILSHILYANDVMLFCKGTSSNIHILSEFFARYTHIYHKSSYQPYKIYYFLLVPYLNQD